MREFEIHMKTQHFKWKLNVKVTNNEVGNKLIIKNRKFSFLTFWSYSFVHHKEDKSTIKAKEDDLNCFECQFIVMIIVFIALKYGKSPCWSCGLYILYLCIFSSFFWFFMQWTLRGLCIGTCFHNLKFGILWFIHATTYWVLCVYLFCFRVHSFPWCSLGSARNNKSSYTAVHHFVHW